MNSKTKFNKKSPKNVSIVAILLIFILSVGLVGSLYVTNQKTLLSLFSRARVLDNPTSGSTSPRYVSFDIEGINLINIAGANTNFDLNALNTFETKIGYRDFDSNITEYIEKNKIEPIYFTVSGKDIKGNNSTMTFGFSADMTNKQWWLNSVWLSYSSPAAYQALTNGGVVIRGFNYSARNQASNLVFLDDRLTAAVPFGQAITVNELKLALQSTIYWDEGKQISSISSDQLRNAGQVNLVFDKAKISLNTDDQPRVVTSPPVVSTPPVVSSTAPRPSNAPSPTPASIPQIQTKTTFKVMLEGRLGKYENFRGNPRGNISIFKNGRQIDAALTTVFAENDGAYSSDALVIRPGKYDLMIKVDGRLSQIFRNIEIADVERVTIDLSAKPLLAGDVNNDNKVDFNDVDQFLAHFNKVLPTQMPWIDFSGNSKVERNDLQLLLNNYNKLGEKL